MAEKETKKHKASIGSRIIQRLQNLAESLEKGEDLSARATCRKVEINLRPTAYDPDLVRTTRRILGASQSIFARFLGVSVKTVRAWEQGVNAPAGIAARFMDEIRSDPKYWRGRLNKTVTVKQTG